MAVQSDNERRNVNHLLADSDVSLSDKDSSVVDRLSQTRLEHLGLQSSLHEVLSLERQNVIESHSLVVEHTDSYQSSDQSVTLEKSLGVLVFELEELSGSSSDLGKGQLNSPDLSLVSETVLAGELEGMKKMGGQHGMFKTCFSPMQKFSQVPSVPSDHGLW